MKMESYPNPILEIMMTPTSVTSFQVHSNLPTSARTFQLRRNFPTSAKLSNSKRSSPTSLGSFQLCSVLSNFNRFFPTSLGSFQLQTFQLKTFQLLVLSNYTHPDFLGDFLKIWNLVWILFPEMTVGDTPKM